MNQALNFILQPRLYTFSAIEGLSIEQLNTIPEGFNNNIIWNLGHMIVAQQNICYKRAGLDIKIDEDFFNTYKSGTKPERLFTADDLAQIKELLSSTLNTLEADLKTGAFANYVPWTTRYSTEINTIHDAISFLPFHEGLHIGTIGAMRKLVVSIE